MISPLSSRTPRAQLALSAALLSASALLLIGFATLDGDRTRWQSNPTFSISGQLTGLAQSAAHQATRAGVLRWQAVSGVNLQLNEVSSNAGIPIELTQTWPQEFGDNASGITLTYRGGGRITLAEVYLNDQNFSWSVAPTTPSSLVDVEGVTAHEIGHALGLTHSFYREATMYWSSSDEQMRSLDDDDERGLRYLYAGVNAGQLCDTCQSNEDCVSGTCINFDGLAFCGADCGPAPQYLCQDAPNTAGCFELQNGGTTCAPLTLACSDEAVGVAEQGDYCFGAQHCQGDLMCIVRADDARCEALGQAGYGEPCEFNAFCESEICLPLSQSEALCTLPCDPNVAVERSGCPSASTCLALNDPNLEGVCLPPGDVPQGGSCNDITLRCQEGFECANGTCQRFCEPYGECPANLACTPVGGRWRCEPLEGPGEGEACQSNRCAGGLFCLQSQQRCLTPCDPSEPLGCAGHACLALSAIGVCSPGEGGALAPCEEDFDCLEMRCVSAPSGSASAQVCAPLCEASACPDGWRCVEGQAGELSVCEPLPPAPPEAGATPPQGGTATGGSPAPQAGQELGGEDDITLLPPQAGDPQEGTVGSAASGPSCAQGSSAHPRQPTPLGALVFFMLCAYLFRFSPVSSHHQTKSEAR